MYALFVVLNKTKYLDEILASFLDIGVTGATILDSQGMASAMANSDIDFAEFGFFRNFMEGSKPYNKTIFTVLENEPMVEKAVAAVKETLGEKAKEGAGFMFSVPLGKVYPMED